jgi:hypothetical protein
MSQHTPGPWIVSPMDDRTIGRLIPKNHQYPQIPGFQGVAVTLYRGEESRPNARLLAAAPEMFAALKDIEFELSHRDDQCMDSAPEDRCAACRAMILARAAIAKAEGTP